jgi:cytochrome c5
MDGSRGTEGRSGTEKEFALRGDTGETGVMKGSSGSVIALGAGSTRDDALASAAREALVGPSSGKRVYGGSCSVCPSGPMMSCSSPSGPRTLW